TRGQQANATDRLAAAYSGAAKTLDGLNLSPADVVANTGLVDALRATGAAYKQAAKEARSKDRAGYKREGDKAAAAQKGVADAIAGLQAAGYDVQPKGEPMQPRQLGIAVAAALAAFVVAFGVSKASGSENKPPSKTTATKLAAPKSVDVATASVTTGAASAAA